MSLEQQLEFPFLNTIRMRLYAEKQYREMRTLYDISYRFDGDFGKEMKFGDFLTHIWIKGDFAKRFHDKHYETYFYDDPQYLLYKSIVPTPKDI